MRKTLSLSVSLGVLFCALTLTGISTPTHAAQVLPNGIYIMQMSDSDMTIAATRGTKGASMILWPYRPSATWDFKHLGRNIYTIRTNANMLDGTHARPGAPVTIAASHGKADQQWKIKRVGKYYQITNVRTGMAMELNNGQRTKGNKLHGNSPSNSRDQLICIQRPNAPRYCGDGRGRPPRERGYDFEDDFDPNAKFRRK